MTTRVEVPARSALVGNPSDAFGGATIAFTIDSLATTVEARGAEAVTLAAADAQLRFADAAALVTAGRGGTYPPAGELALLMASAKRYCEWLAGRGGRLDDLGFELAVTASTIPPQVGLAGSSAVVVGALSALGELLGNKIPQGRLPSFALVCETAELGITAGLQDRVVQAMGGLVYMDFDAANVAGGDYAKLDRSLLPRLFVAWLGDAATDSGRTHQSVRERFDRGDREVIDAMSEIAQLARAGREALTSGDHEALGALMTRNLALRKQVYTLDPRHEKLVDAARGLGLPANYTGSGGAIVALRGDRTREELDEAFEPLGASVLPI